MLRRALLPIALLALALAGTGCDLGQPENEQPVAAFSATVDRLTVSFTNESRDPYGSLQSARWEFGDGDTSTVGSPTHTYDETGTYTVTLTVTDDQGATASTSKSISLNPSLNVFVANQGNPDGSGVTVHDRDSSETTRRAVEGLQSFVQGIRVHEGRLFVAASSGGRVDVFSARGFSQVGQVSDLSGPRYLTFPKDETAVLSDQSFGGSSSLRVLDLSGDQPQVQTTVDVPGQPEGVTTTSGRVYAALGGFSDTTLVAALNAETNELTETIDVGCAPRFVLADTQSEVYAVCIDKKQVVRLDGSSGDQLGTLSLPDTAETASGVGQTAFFAPEARELYVVVNADRVVRIDTRAEEVATTFGPVEGDPIGGVAYDPEREELYLGRVPDFSSAGTVTIHDRSGTETGSFPAGVAPTYITFRRTGSEAAALP
jgi:PKD repeat protein